MYREQTTDRLSSKPKSTTIPISCVRHDDTHKLVYGQHKGRTCKQQQCAHVCRYVNSLLSMSGLLLSTVTVFFRGLPCLMDCSSWSLACAGLPPFLAPPPKADGPGGGGGGGGPDVGAGGGGGGGGGGKGMPDASVFKGPYGTTNNAVATCGRSTWGPYDGRTVSASTSGGRLPRTCACVGVTHGGLGPMTERNDSLVV